jgi:predicted nucleotidyltransferase
MPSSTLLPDVLGGGELSQVVDVAREVRERRADILRIARSHGGTRVRIFGSVRHGTAKADSDLDPLIDLEPDSSLLDLVAIKQDLEDLLGREVHVVTEDAISPHIHDAILRDALPL